MSKRECGACKWWDKSKIYSFRLYGFSECNLIGREPSDMVTINGPAHEGLETREDFYCAHYEEREDG